MASINEKLADEAVQHSIDTTGYSNWVVRRMLSLLLRVDADLMAQLQVSLHDLTPEAFSVQRLEGLLVSVRALNRQLYEQLQAELTQELRGFAAAEAGYHQALFQTVLPPQISVTTVTMEQVYSAAFSRPFQGRLLSEWIQSLEQGQAVRIRDTIRMGYVEGKTISQMVREIRGTKAQDYKDGILEIDRRNAEAVVRTAVSHTAASARDAFYEANADLIKGVVWKSTLDSRTSHTCFPGSTLPLPIGNLLGISRRLWNGDVVVVTTASGKKLRATPNHPVLTARGWRAIQELQPGADVLYRVTGDVGRVPSTKDVEMPASFSTIFDSLNKPAFSDVFVESTSEIDFHGDGMAGYHEVNQPRSECDLRLALEAAFGEQVTKQLLVFVGVPGRLPSERKPKPVLVGLGLVNVPPEFGARPIEDGVKPGLADLGYPADVCRLGAGDEHLNDLRFIRAACHIATTKSGHDASALKDARHGGGRDSVETTDRCCGLPSGVAPDDVVSVEREFFSGHVFNLSTSTESYIADGFVVHNCRIRDGKQYTQGDHKPIGHKLPWLSGPGKAHWGCRSTSSPVVKSWKELTGVDVAEFTPSQRASMDGAVPEDTTYADWIKKQSASRQDEILGPARGKLLREGGLSLDRFANDRGRWLTLSELEERNASAFKRAGLQ